MRASTRKLHRSSFLAIQDRELQFWLLVRVQPPDRDVTVFSRRHLESFNPKELLNKRFSLLVASSFNSKSKRMQMKDFSHNIEKHLIENEKHGGSIIFCTDSLSRVFEFILQIEFVLKERKLQEVYKFYLLESLRYPWLKQEVHRCHQNTERIHDHSHL